MRYNPDTSKWNKWLSDLAMWYVLRPLHLPSKLELSYLVSPENLWKVVVVTIFDFLFFISELFNGLCQKYKWYSLWPHYQQLPATWCSPFLIHGSFLLLKRYLATCRITELVRYKHEVDKFRSTLLPYYLFDLFHNQGKDETLLVSQCLQWHAFIFQNIPLWEKIHKLTCVHKD